MGFEERERSSTQTKTTSEDAAIASLAGKQTQTEALSPTSPTSSTDDFTEARALVVAARKTGTFSEAALAALVSIVRQHGLPRGEAFINGVPYSPEQAAYWRIRISQLTGPARDAYDAACKQAGSMDLATWLGGSDPIATLVGERKAKRGGSDAAVDALAMIAFEKTAADIQAGAVSAMPSLQMKAVQQSPIDLARAEARVQGAGSTDVDAVRAVLALAPADQRAHGVLLQRMGWREGVVPAMKRLETMLQKPQRVLDLLYVLRRYREASADTSPDAIKVLAELLQQYNRDPRRVEGALAAIDGVLVIDVEEERTPPASAQPAYVQALRFLEPKRDTRTTRVAATTEQRTPTTSSTPVVVTRPKDEIGEVRGDGESGYTAYVTFAPGETKLADGYKNEELMIALLRANGVDAKIASWMATYTGEIDPLTGGKHERKTGGGYRGYAIRNSDASIMSEEQIDAIFAKAGSIQLRLATAAIELGKQLFEKFGTNLDAWTSMDRRADGMAEQVAKLEEELAANPGDVKLKQQLDWLRSQVTEGRQYADRLRKGETDPATDRTALQGAIDQVDGLLLDAAQQQQQLGEQLAKAREEIRKANNGGLGKDRSLGGGELGTAVRDTGARIQYNQSVEYINRLRAQKNFLLWRQQQGLPVPADHATLVAELAKYYETTDGKFRPMSIGEGVRRTVVASVTSTAGTLMKFGGGVMRDVPSEILFASLPGVTSLRQYAGQTLVDWGKGAEDYATSERKYATRALGETGVQVVDFVTSTALMMIVTMGVGSLGAAAGRGIMVGGQLVATGTRAAAMSEVAGQSLALGTFGYFSAADKSVEERLFNAVTMALGPLFGNKGGTLRKMAAGFISNMAIDAGSQIEYRKAFAYYAETKDMAGAAQLATRTLEQNFPRVFMSGLMGLSAGANRTPRPRALLEVETAGGVKTYDWSFAGGKLDEVTGAPRADADRIKVNQNEFDAIVDLKGQRRFDEVDEVIARAEARREQLESSDAAVRAMNKDIKDLEKAPNKTTDQYLALGGMREEAQKLQMQRFVIEAESKGRGIPEEMLTGAELPAPPGYRYDQEQKLWIPDKSKLVADNAELRARAKLLGDQSEKYRSSVSRMDRSTGTILSQTSTDATRIAARTKLQTDALEAKSTIDDVQSSLEPPVRVESSALGDKSASIADLMKANDNYLRYEDAPKVEAPKLGARIGTGATADVYAGTTSEGQAVAVKVYRDADPMEANLDLGKLAQLRKYGGPEVFGLTTIDLDGKPRAALLMEKIDGEPARNFYEGDGKPIKASHISGFKRILDDIGEAKDGLTDANGGNWLLTKDGRVVPIDMGLVPVTEGGTLRQAREVYAALEAKFKGQQDTPVTRVETTTTPIDTPVAPTTVKLDDLHARRIAILKQAKPDVAVQYEGYVRRGQYDLAYWAWHDAIPSAQRRSLGIDDLDDRKLQSTAGATEADLKNAVNGTCQNAAVVNAVLAKMAGFKEVEIITLNARVETTDLIGAGFAPAQLDSLMSAWQKYGGAFRSGHAIIRVRGADGKWRYISYGDVELLEAKILPGSYRGQIGGTTVPVTRTMPYKTPQDIDAFLKSVKADNIAYFTRPGDDLAPLPVTQRRPVADADRTVDATSSSRTAPLATRDRETESLEEPRTVAGVGWMRESEP
jgi:hypothetical protein